MSAEPRSLARRVARTLAPVVLLAATIAPAENAAQTAVVEHKQPRPTGGHATSQFVVAWDDDGDEKVSREEYDVARTQRFKVTDSNGDGVLSTALSLTIAATLLAAIHPAVAAEEPAMELGKIKVTADEEGRSTVGNTTVVCGFLRVAGARLPERRAYGAGLVRCARHHQEHAPERGCLQRPG
jgi:hypothetical protein